MFRTLLSRCTLSAARNSNCLMLMRQYTTDIDFAKLVKNNKVVIFMKGVPDLPRCGFSNTAVLILKAHGVEFDHHDVLSSRDLREGIKKFSDWPTIPQIFINGEFIGGCDVLHQMHKSGELIKKLEAAGIKSTFLENEENQEEKTKKKGEKGEKGKKGT